jgi:hypothetical protein
MAVFHDQHESWQLAFVDRYAPSLSAVDLSRGKFCLNRPVLNLAKADLFTVCK